ncbi:hypothetical protein BVIET440_60241 [Burkholderia vietnamiensis]
MGEQHDVAAALAEWGFVDAKHAQAEVQIRTKAPLLYCSLEVDMGCGYDARVYGYRNAPAEPLDLAALQKSEQARLALERHVTDFVKKQGTAVGGLNASNLALMGTGKRATFASEEFGLKQC